MTPTSDLIARLERASGPDRELDGAIYRFIANVPEWKRGPTNLGHVEGPNGKIIISPRYTESIDAAMTLVPADWTIYEMGQTHRHGEGWYVTMMHKTRSDLGDAFSGHATLSIALCIAALRAIEQSQERVTELKPRAITEE